VAGLNVATCVTARDKMSSMYQHVTAAYASFDERILNVIVHHFSSDPDTTMAVLRELFRQLVGSKTDRARILRRAKSSSDPFGKVFQTLSGTQQAELLAILPP
jgi:hypothetical protein